MCDGKELTHCATSRNSKGYIALLADVEAANPTGEIYIIDFQSLESQQRRDQRLAGRASAPPSRLHSHQSMLAQCGLEGWWRLFRPDALAGQSFANPKEFEQPPIWRPFNSIYEPSPGAGDGFPRRPGVAVASFVTVFKELSTSNNS